MITKEEAKIKIKKAGYNVVDDNSVITILIPENASIKNTVKSVKELLLKIDYQASFGVKQHSGAEEIDGETKTNEIDGENLSDEMNEEILAEEVDEATEALIEDVELVANEAVEDKTSSKSKKTSKKTAKKEVLDDDDFLDDEDENLDKLDNVKLDELDMDMMLNEDSIQFSLEDFGLM